MKICKKYITRGFGHSLKLSKDGKKAFIACENYLEVVTLENIGE